MRARVDEVSLTGTGMLYLSVSFYASPQSMTPVMVNDFVIQLPPASQVVPVFDSTGRFPTDETQTIIIDRRAYVRQIVIDFAKRAAAKRWNGDLRDRRIQRRALDADSTDMADLMNAEVTG